LKKLFRIFLYTFKTSCTMNSQVSCPKCTLLNDIFNESCIICGHNFLSPSPETYGRWTCKACTQQNCRDALQCKTCEMTKHSLNETMCPTCRQAKLPKDSCPYCKLFWKCAACGKSNSLTNEICVTCQWTPTERVKALIRAQTKVWEKNPKSRELEDQSEIKSITEQIDGIDGVIRTVSENSLERMYPKFIKNYETFRSTKRRRSIDDIDGPYFCLHKQIESYFFYNCMDSLLPIANQWVDKQLETFEIPKEVSEIISTYIGMPAILETSLQYCISSKALEDSCALAVSKVEEQLKSIRTALNRNLEIQKSTVKLNPFVTKLSDATLQTWWRCPTCSKKNYLYFDKCQNCNSPEEKIAYLERQMRLTLVPNEKLNEKLEKQERLRSWFIGLNYFPDGVLHDQSSNNRAVTENRKRVTAILAAKKTLALYVIKSEIVNTQLQIFDEQKQRFLLLSKNSVGIAKCLQNVNRIEPDYEDPHFGIIQYTEERISHELFYKMQMSLKSSLMTIFEEGVAKRIVEFSLCVSVDCGCCAGYRNSYRAANGIDIVEELLSKLRKELIKKKQTLEAGISTLQDMANIAMVSRRCEDCEAFCSQSEKKCHKCCSKSEGERLIGTLHKQIAIVVTRFPTVA